MEWWKLFRVDLFIGSSDPINTGKSINKRQKLPATIISMLGKGTYEGQAYFISPKSLRILMPPVSSATGTRRSDLNNQWDECFDTSKSEWIPAFFNRKSSTLQSPPDPRFLLNRLGIGPYNQAVLLHQGGIGTGSIRPCKNISVFSQKKGKSSFFLVWRLQPSAE